MYVKCWGNSYFCNSVLVSKGTQHRTLKGQVEQLQLLLILMDKGDWTDLILFLLMHLDQLNFTMQYYLAIAYRTISYILTIADSLQGQGSTLSRMLTTPATPPNIDGRGLLIVYLLQEWFLIVVSCVHSVKEEGKKGSFFLCQKPTIVKPLLE